MDRTDHAGVARLKPLAVEDFRKLARLVETACGVRLDDDRLALLQGRLLRRLRSLGLSSYADYYRFVVADASGVEVERLVDLATTHSTSFFRETAHYEHLRRAPVRSYLHRRVHLSDEVFRVWSAGCSTGEETYSLVMVLLETLPRGTPFRVYGSDVSPAVIAFARGGRYSDLQVEGVPPSFLARYFRGVTGGPGRSSLYEVSDDLRSRVEFQPHNLVSSDFPPCNAFDAIFCRNVLMYFSRESQTVVANRLVRHLRPGGYVYTGLSESLLWVDNELEHAAPSVYVLPATLSSLA
ncbi:MAG: methyltransferase domain-containing protein [Planctomycetota bacterium]|nr:methyltransferase domain-containing protein [Planctomycetota bacterium]